MNEVQSGTALLFTSEAAECTQCFVQVLLQRACSMFKRLPIVCPCAVLKRGLVHILSHYWGYDNHTSCWRCSKEEGGYLS
jgi:hypothetical protein